MVLFREMVVVPSEVKVRYLLAVIEPSSVTSTVTLAVKPPSAVDTVMVAVPADRPVIVASEVLAAPSPTTETLIRCEPEIPFEVLENIDF